MSDDSESQFVLRVIRVAAETGVRLKSPSTQWAAHRILLESGADAHDTITDAIIGESLKKLREDEPTQFGAPTAELEKRRVSPIERLESANAVNLAAKPKSQKPRPELRKPSSPAEAKAVAALSSALKHAWSERTFNIAGFPKKEVAS